jgi:hypothetical protein
MSVVVRAVVIVLVVVRAGGRIRWLCVPLRPRPVSVPVAVRSAAPEAGVCIRRDGCARAMLAR